MSLTIKNAVIHEVIKDENSIASISLSGKQLNSLDENINLLMDKLDNIFQNRAPKRAKLLDDSLFKNFIDNKEVKFLKESGGLIEQLKTQLTNLTQAKGGYFLFVEYQSIANFLAVFILRNTKGFISKNESDHFVLDEVTHLDTNKLAMGMRINLDIYNNSENEDRKKRYVSLIRGTTDISKYFGNWIGINDARMESVDATSLMEIASHIDLPDGVQDREGLRRKIGEFASNSSNDIVNLTALSLSVFGSETYLAEYCNSNEIDIDDEFKISKANIKKFFNIIVNIDGIKLSFSRDKIDDSISINDTKVIINSSSLVQEINSQK